MSNEFRKVYLESLKGGQKKLDKDKDGKIEKSDLAKLRAEEVINEGEYEKAEENKRSAEAAKSQARPFDYHMHMADHHDNMSQWHASKGRHGEAAKHAEKSDEHHEKAMSVKESVELDEATPYYNKPSFLKRMSAAAKQERLAREKKEREAKAPVKEESELEEAKYNHNDNRRGFGRREREDDEYHVPDPEVKNKIKKEVKESTVPDHMKGKQKPYVSSDGKGNHEVLGNTGQTKATFTRKEHGPAAKAKAIAHLKKHYDTYMKEEVELDEAAAQLDEIGDTAKGRKALGQYVKKAANNMASNKSALDRTKPGESHVADTASRKWANRRVGISGAVNRLTKEEIIDEARVNGREYASHGLMHPDHAKMDIHKVSGHHVDFYASKTGDKMQGKVVKNDGKEVHIQAHKDKEIGDGKLHKFKVKSSLPKTQNEGLDIKKSGMGDVIKDFSKSDAPQFKGKSAAKRRQMAIAAKLSNEETEMSEQEQLDELSKKTLGSYVKKAANDKADTAFHRGYSAYNNSNHKPYSEPKVNKVHAGQENRNKGIKRAVDRLTKEEHTMSFKAFLEEGLTEGVWPGTPEYKKKFPETSRGKVGDKKVGAKGTQTVTSTGVKHERDYEKAEKETGSTETQEKRGRGRPAGSKSGARNK